MILCCVLSATCRSDHLYAVTRHLKKDVVMMYNFKTVVTFPKQYK